MPFENSVPSQVIWVSPDGNDNNAGSQDAPLQSIQLAIDRATPGTAILLMPGDYTGNYEFQGIQGTADKPIWLAAAEGPGSVTITAASNDESVITIRGEDNIIIRDLKLVGGYDGIEITQSGNDFTDLVHNIVLQGNTIIGAANDGIKLGQTDNALIVGNVVDGAGDQGIDMLGVTNVTVDGNEIMNVTGSSGMFMKGGSSDLVITNNYIHDVAGDGLLVGGWSNADAFLPGTDYEARNVTVTGNVVEDAAKRPLTVLGAQNVDIHGNSFGSMDSNEHVVEVGAGSPELSPRPQSSAVAIHDNVFDRAYNLTQVDPGSENISVFDNQTDGVIDGDMRTDTPEADQPSFVSTLPEALLDAPVWATSARSILHFTAGSGNQTLVGTDGNDFLSGGDGTDTTIGGRGDDVYSIGSWRDVVIEKAGEGIDTVIAYTSSYTLADNVENITVAYSGGGTYKGNALDNIFRGAAGNDKFTGGDGHDLFVASSIGGADVITDFSPGSGDRVDLRAVAGFADLGDVLAHASQNGSAVTISLGTTATLTLNAVNLADLTSDDFLFLTPSGPANATPTGIALSSASVSEAATPGTVIGTLAGFDTDQQETLTFSLASNPGGLFAINDHNQLIVAGAPDYETSQTQSVTVRVTDSAHNTYDQSFDITVTNAPPSTPSDADKTANLVDEGAANGTLVGLTAEAFDPHGGAITYALVDDAGGRFAIDPTTGVVTVADGSLLNYGQDQSHDIVVAALDGSGAVSNATFTIDLVGVEGATITGTAGADVIDATHTPEGQPLPTVVDDTIDGGGGNDFLSALAGNDLLIGGAGADALDGGTGVDTASYAGAHSAIAVSLATGSGSVGDAAGDLLWNIENVIGSSYADTIEGDGGNNTLVGGYGVDTLSYEHAAAGITVSLAVEQAQDTGGAGIDTISGFEYLTGSTFDDVLTGSKVANVLKGGDGNDVLFGGDGNDLLMGGNGTDTMTGGAGADGFIFNAPGEVPDTITDFTSGSDWMRIAASAFGGGLQAGHQPTLLTVADIAAASAPAGAGAFIFDNSGQDAGTVYWDATGGTTDDAIQLAHLTGVTKLAAGDFHII